VQQLDAALAYHNRVFDLQPTPTELVVRRFDAHDHAFLDDLVIARRQVGHVIPVQADAMADVASRIVRNPGRARCLHCNLEDPRGLDAGTDRLESGHYAVMKRLVVSDNLGVRLPKHSDSSDIGTVMSVAATHVESDHIAPAQRSIRGMYIGHGRPRAEADTAEHRGGVMLNGRGMERARHLNFRDAFTCHFQCGIHRALCNGGHHAQALDFHRRLHGANLAEQLRCRHDRGLGQFLLETLPLSRHQAHFVDGEGRFVQPLISQALQQRVETILFIGKVK
jgi:hypothetical protein